MEFISSLLSSGFLAVVPFVVLLGILVFIHELGHFAVAKWCGVRVEVFSLGFGKKLLKYQRGDTLYCVSLIPLGGYVKMFGDDPTAVPTEEERRVSFLHKPVWQRIAIVLAGPLMNFFFAVLIFALIAMSGEQARQPVVGDVPLRSEAWEMGLRSGDKILTANGQKIQTWEQFQQKLNQAANQKIALEVARPGFTNNFNIELSPTLKPNPNILSLDEMIGDVGGLSSRALSGFIGVRPGSMAQKLGFQTGDQIIEVNGNKVGYFRELEPLMLQLAGQEIKFLIKRWGGVADIEAQQDVSTTEMLVKLPSFGSLLGLGIERSDLYLSKVMPDSPAAKAGLQSGDRVLAIGDVEPMTWEDILNQVKSFSGEGALNFRVARGETMEEIAIAVTPQMTAAMSGQGLREKRFTVGIVPWVSIGEPLLTKVTTSGLVAQINRGFEKTWEVTVMTVVSFLRLIKNEISPKNIGGVISIGQAATETFKMGFYEFFSMMAIISVNLFILNLLPIPVLDGGHLLFFTIEAIRGTPVSLRKMEIAQQFGLVVLMSLMIFALYNDFTRVLGIY